MSLNLFKNGDSKYHDIIDMTRVLTRLSVTMTGVNLTLYLGCYPNRFLLIVSGNTKEHA